MINTALELEAYKAHLTLSNFKAPTIKSYARTLEKFFLFWLEHYSNEVPNQDHVQAYFLRRVEAVKASPKSESV